MLRQRFRRLSQRFQTPLLVVLGILLAFIAMALFDSAKPPPQRLTQRDINAAVAIAMASATPSPSFASQAYAAIRPSLVQLSVTRQGANPDPSSASPNTSVGAGVVVAENGTILTALHVVGDATAIRVTFSDGTQANATVVGKQEDSDLAVLRPDVIPDDLQPATLAGGPNVGDEVFAAGSPFGIAGSLTAGVVSGLGREYKPPIGQKLTNLIQFDAAVNPGNSGGPLVDRNGEVVGIVTGLVNPTGQEVFIGIGLAVPIETAGGVLGTPPF